jgi:hypothetical protein
MLELLAFAVVAAALATPLVVPLMWGQLEQPSQDTATVARDELPIGPAGLTVCAALIAAAAFMQAAHAQPLPNDPERFHMIEQCLELTFGRSGGNYTHHMYKACMEDHAITTLHAAPETAADFRRTPVPDGPDSLISQQVRDARAGPGQLAPRRSRHHLQVAG